MFSKNFIVTGDNLDSTTDTNNPVTEGFAKRSRSCAICLEKVNENDPGCCDDEINLKNTSANHRLHQKCRLDMIEQDGWKPKNCPFCQKLLKETPEETVRKNE